MPRMNLETVLSTISRGFFGRGFSSFWGMGVIDGGHSYNFISSHLYLQVTTFPKGAYQKLKDISLFITSSFIEKYYDEKNSGSTPDDLYNTLKHNGLDAEWSYSAHEVYPDIRDRYIIIKYTNPQRLDPKKLSKDIDMVCDIVQEATSKKSLVKSSDEA